MPKRIWDSLDASFVHNLLKIVGHHPAFGNVRYIAPLVYWEIQALGPEKFCFATSRTVKLRLQDGRYYKLKYVHEDIHSLVLYRMGGALTNETIVATFDNATTQDAVHQALNNPEALAQVA